MRNERDPTKRLRLIPTFITRQQASTRLCVAELTPEHVMDIPAMLDHTAPETSERSYNLAGAARAAKTLATEIQNIRSNKRRPPPREVDEPELNPIWAAFNR